jgi:hypothetical protein
MCTICQFFPPIYKQLLALSGGQWAQLRNESSNIANIASVVTTVLSSEVQYLV